MTLITAIEASNLFNNLSDVVDVSTSSWDELVILVNQEIRTAALSRRQTYTFHFAGMLPTAMENLGKALTECGFITMSITTSGVTTMTVEW